MSVNCEEVEPQMQHVIDDVGNLVWPNECLCDPHSFPIAEDPPHIIDCFLFNNVETSNGMQV